MNEEDSFWPEAESFLNGLMEEEEREEKEIQEEKDNEIREVIFQKYPSIENSYREKFMKNLPNGGDQWLVTEKVHGANFAFYITDKEIKCAKRTGFLDKDESFYNYQSVLEKYSSTLRKIYDEVISFFTPKVDTLIIFGELYGGRYPPYEENKKMVGVQKEVLYSREVDFIAFDISLDGVFLPYDRAIDVLSHYNFPHIPIIYEGNLDQCLEFSTKTKARASEIYKLHNLEEVEDNIREGNVIRPKEDAYLPSGSRIIIKDKNEKFSEIQKEVKIDRLNDEGETILNEICNYITENRLNAVISKIGEGQNFNKLAGMLMKDVLDEYSRDWDRDYPFRKSSQYKLISNAAKMKCLNLIYRTQ